MAEQRQLFAKTVKVCRCLCKHLLGILKLTFRKDSEAYAGKSPRYSPRSWAWQRRHYQSKTVMLAYGVSLPEVPQGRDSWGVEWARAMGQEHCGG